MFSVTRLGDLLQFCHLFKPRVYICLAQIVGQFLKCLSFSSENCFGNFRLLFIDIVRLLLKPSGHPAYVPCTVQLTT